MLLPVFHRSRGTLLVLFLGLVCATPVGAQAPALAKVLAGLDVTEASLQTLTMDLDTESGLFHTSVELGGVTHTIELHRHSLRSDDFQVYADVGGGELVAQPDPPIVTWRGTVLEDPDAIVVASYLSDDLRAMVYTDQGTWGIQPVSDSGQPGAANQYVVYSKNDLLIPEGFCGVSNDDAPEIPEGGAGPQGTGQKIADIGLDADREYYLINGSSLVATVNDMESILNFVSNVYEQPPISITYEITTVVVRTVEPDPYSSTSAGALLNQFDSAWSTSPENFIRRDVAHLFTGKNLSGNIIGVANIATVCITSAAFALSQSRYTSNINLRISLTAHELGHTWAGLHCNTQPPCHIMCTPNGGCQGVNPPIFGPSATTQIVAFKNTRSCLVNLADPQPRPFIEEWTSTLLDTSKWTYNFNSSINSGASGEPSPPNSLNMDRFDDSLPYQDDEIRTNFILMQGTTDPTLRYYTQQGGVSAGEELVVEYLTSLQHWSEINRITSDGSVQTTFQEHLHSLPPNARHNQFRVRFRAEVNSSGDDWYVDNISVTDGLPVNATLRIESIVGFPGATVDS
ncbi:MAG: M12 family metallo-peptidase, partial [Planctomycetota bacterium]